MAPKPLSGMGAKPLNQKSGMPQMMAAFANWMVDITLIIITQTVVEGNVINKESSVTYRGTFQPLSPEEIKLKPDGQRSWEWSQIHSFAGDLNLKTNDRIEYNGVRFKVMNRLDYSLNNYIEYHVIRDYQDDIA